MGTRIAVQCVVRKSIVGNSPQILAKSSAPDASKCAGWHRQVTDQEVEAGRFNYPFAKPSMLNRVLNVDSAAEKNAASTTIADRRILARNRFEFDENPTVLAGIHELQLEL